MPEHALESVAPLGRIADAEGRASYLKGEALRELCRYTEAIPLLESATIFLPDDIHVYLALAWCYKRADCLPLAIEALERALDVDSSEAILHYNLACYWSLAHNRSVSLRHLVQALEIDGDFRELVIDEPDFDHVREDPDFQLLVGRIV